MNAGFFKRMFSSVIDITVVIFVVYLTFSLLARPLLQNRIENYSQIDSSYSQIVTNYQEELTNIKTEYDANMTDAGDDTDAQAAATDLYQAKLGMLNQQNTINIQPYQYPLSVYFVSQVYYFIGVFAILMSVYTILLKSKTLGRRLLNLELEGKINPFTVFMHDVAFKYLIFLLALAYNPYYGLLLLVIIFLADLFMISMSGRKSALRDRLLNMRVIDNKVR